MKNPLSSWLAPKKEGTFSYSRRNLVPFILLSLILHAIFFGVASWTASHPPRLILLQKKEKKLHPKKEAKKEKKKKEKEKLVYVKILNIPKPKKEEKPKKSHIIAQYSMKKKGPRGKQERSSLSGESSSLNYRPGLPITPPRPRITLVPGQQPISPPKLEAKKETQGKGAKAKKRPKLAQKGKKAAPPPQKGKGEKGKATKGKEKLAQKESKGTQKGKKTSAQKEQERKKKGQKGEKREKLVRVMPQTGPQTQIIPPLPRRKIPLFDPSLINEQSNKIVPQMGQGESQEISLDTTNSKYISYFKHIRDKLYLVWRYPLEARMNGIQGVAYILFVIDRSGKLKEVKLLKSSGSSILDKEAERALRAAAPFGPFPPDWPDKELRIRARFIYRLFGLPFH